MFALVVLDLILQYLANRLAGHNVSKMTCFYFGWDVKL